MAHRSADVLFGMVYAHVQSLQRRTCANHRVERWSMLVLTSMRHVRVGGGVSRRACTDGIGLCPGHAAEVVASRLPAGAAEKERSFPAS